jgi:hypothetical protein
MAIIGFEQDPDPSKPFGAGLFHSDGGDSAYLFDPDLAKAVSAPSAPSVMAPQRPEPAPYDVMQAIDQPDHRLALNNASSEEPNASMADVGPNYSAPPSAPTSAPNASMAPNMSVAPPQGQAPPAQVPQGPPPDVDQDELLRKSQQAYVNAPVYHAPVRGGLRPKTAEVITEGAGPPLTEEDAKQYREANDAILQSHISQAAAVTAQADRQVAEVQAVMPALQQRYAEEQSKYEAARSSARQDLAKVNGMLQDVSAMKIDHNRFFTKNGAVGNIVAGIGYMLGAGAAALNHTDNPVNSFIERDIADQRSAIENGRANANNALQMLRDKYNYDLPQAESALKMAQLGVVNAQLKQFEGMKLGQDARLGLESWYAENQKAIFMEARKLYADSLGKQTRKESLTYQQGSAGGLAAPTPEQQLKRLAVIKASQDTGTIPKPGDEKDKIDPQLVVYDTEGRAVAARKPEEATKIREKYALYKQVMPSLGAMAETAGHFNTLSGDEQATFKLNFEVAASTVNSMLGQNSMKDDDFKRWNDYMSQGNFGVQKAISEVRKIAQNGYQAQVDAQSGAQVKEDFSKGKPRVSYQNKRAPTPTVGRANSSDASEEQLKGWLEENAK